MALLRLGSVLMSESLVTTKGHATAQGLGRHLRPYWCLRAMLQPGPYKSEWPVLLPGDMVTSRPELQLRAMSVFMSLLQPGAMLMSVAPVTIEGHADTWGHVRV